MDFIEAMKWTQAQMRLLADGGMWFIPRSGAVFRLESRERREVSVNDMKKEEAVQDILRARGWHVVEKKGQKRATKST